MKGALGDRDRRFSKDSKRFTATISFIKKSFLGSQLFRCKFCWIDEIRWYEGKGKRLFLLGLRSGPFMFYKFRVTFFNISLIEGDALLVIQEVMLIFVDLLDLLSSQFLEDFVALLITGLVVPVFEPFLLGVVGQINFLTFVLAFSLAGAGISWKERAYFGLEITNGVSATAFHTQVDGTGRPCMQHLQQKITNYMYFRKRDLPQSRQNGIRQQQMIRGRLYYW